MTTFKSLVVALAMLFCGCSSLSNLGSGEAPMVGRDGLKFVQVIIEGKKSFMIVDTGAKTTLLDKRFCDRVGISYTRSSEALNGLGGKVSMFRSKSFSFQFLGKFITYRTNVSDLTHMVAMFDTHNIEVAGILGSDFFTYYKCIIDYNSGKIYFNNEKDK